MGSTPIYQIPYVEGTDTLATFPAAMKAQSERIENITPKWGEFRQGADQAVTSGAAVTALVTATVNGGGFTVSQGIITIPTPGVYQVSAQLTYGGMASAAGFRFAYLNLNGITVVRGSTSLPTGTQPISIALAKVIWVTSAGWELKLQAYHTQGTAITVDSTNIGTYITLARL